VPFRSVSNQQQCFSLTPNQHQPLASQQYFSLTANQHQPPASQTKHHKEMYTYMSPIPLTELNQIKYFFLKNGYSNPWSNGYRLWVIPARKIGSISSISKSYHSRIWTQIKRENPYLLFGVWDLEWEIVSQVTRNGGDAFISTQNTILPWKWSVGIASLELPFPSRYHQSNI